MGYYIRSTFSDAQKKRHNDSYQHGYNHCHQMRTVTGVDLRHVLYGDHSSLTGTQMIQLVQVPLLILKKLASFFPSNDCMHIKNPREQIKIQQKDEKTNGGWMTRQRMYFSFSECPKDISDPIVDFILEQRSTQEDMQVPTREELIKALDYFWIRSKLSTAAGESLAAFVYGQCPILGELRWYKNIAEISKIDPEDCVWTLGSH